MKSEKKEGYALYHGAFLSSKFKRGYVIALIFWLIVGYGFCYFNANSLMEAGKSTAKDEHVVSLFIKVLTPTVIYGLLLLYTQAPIFHFLEDSRHVLLYKMFPKSFEKFRNNLIVTYIVASVGLPIFCILYMLLFCPTYLVFAMYGFSLMLPMSASIIYMALCRKEAVMIWDMLTPIFIIITTSLCMLGNERYYDDRLLHTISSLCFYVLCVFITFKIIYRIIHYMKGEWSR